MKLDVVGKWILLEGSPRFSYPGLCLVCRQGRWSGMVPSSTPCCRVNLTGLIYYAYFYRCKPSQMGAVVAISDEDPLLKETEIFPRILKDPYTVISRFNRIDTFVNITVSQQIFFRERFILLTFPKCF